MKGRTPGGRLVVTGVMTLVAAVATVPQAQAVEAQVWAFLYADRPATASYQPDDQAGSTTNIRSTVNRMSTGSYRVTIAGAGAPGVPVVTAVGGNGLHCQLSQFRQNTTAEEVSVNCYAAGGVSADSKFTLSFFSSVPPDSGAPGAYGYVYNTQTKPIQVNPPLRYNSTGGNVDIYHNRNTGIWTVRFFGQAFANAGGNVQVVPVGLTPARCAVLQWYPHQLGADAQVRCDAGLGSPAWTLVYAHERSIVGSRSGFFGYLQANQPTSPSYIPNPDRNRAAGDGVMHRVTRSGPGDYHVEIFGPLKAPNTVHLSVNGDTSHYCDIVGWTMNPAAQPAGVVDVACFDANGRPADNWFSLNYFSP